MRDDFDIAKFGLSDLVEDSFKVMFPNLFMYVQPLV